MKVYWCSQSTDCCYKNWNFYHYFKPLGEHSGEEACILIAIAQIFFPVGGEVAYLVTENDEDVFPCVWSLPAGKACFPSFFPLVIPPAIFHLLCLSKGRKRQKPWMQAKQSDPVTIKKAGALILPSSQFLIGSNFLGREEHPQTQAPHFLCFTSLYDNFTSI